VVSVLDLLTELMATAEGRCAYAEARHVDAREEWVAVLSGRIDALESSASEGIGVRVRVGGGWGFSATREVTRAGAEEALARALAIAEAQPSGPPQPLAPVEPALGHWASEHAVDPFSIALEEKLDLLFAAEAGLRIGDERLVRTTATARSWRERKAFASTVGAACTQELVATGAGIAAYAGDGTELQMRTYPGAHGGGLAAAAGWEHVRALDLAAHAPRVASEAIELLSAPPCPAGTRTIVLHGEQVALQVHESIGHALELDRILLGEASYAGTSWVAPTDLGSLRYGSDLLHVTADATLPGGLGSFGWDDEGVAARRTVLIEGGVLRAALSNRESAAAIGLDASGGCARADGFARQPIVRMTNVSLEPGSVPTLTDLIADTDDGLYLESNRSWSIDDRRLQFQFATEVCREIRGGELGRLYRNGSYAGVTPRFWGSMDAVCGPDEWELWGLTNCGKGEPGQVMEVSHGAAPARFRDVQVGVA
jgi:TldD protein